MSTSTPSRRTEFLDTYVIHKIFLTGKIIFFSGVNRCLVSELLDLLLGASSLHDFEHVEGHILLKGWHSRTMKMLPIWTSLKQGDRCTDMVLWLYFHM